MRLCLLFALTPLALLAQDKQTKPKTVPIGPNVTLEVGETRRVIVTAEVCLRKGPLEGLLTRSKKKEHEYILAADIDARHLHTALETAGAREGSAVQFQPRFRPATGTAIKILLRHHKNGKAVTVPASEWISHHKTKKRLDHDWVFAGSRFVDRELENGKQKYYLANDGDLVCVVNQESALLDLPVRSTKNFKERLWQANTEMIPEEKTRVEVIFEPVIPKKK